MGNSEVRVHNDDVPFAQISRTLLQDSNLSFACRGMLAYLLSKTKDWACKTYDIEREGNLGREARRSLFMEAEIAGYLAFRKKKEENGTFVSSYDFYRAPLPETERTRSWETGNYQNGKGIKNKRLRLKVKPDTGFPHPVEPHPVSPAPVERPPYMNHDVHERDIPNTDILLREESLKPSLTAAAVGDVLPLFSASPQRDNNSATDKSTPSVHDVRVADSFAAGGAGSGGILPQVAPGSFEGCTGLASPASTQSSPVSASVRGIARSGKASPRTVKASKLPPDPRASHPAIAAVRDLANRFPDKILWDKIIELLGDSPDISKLKACFMEHVERGFNKNSWKWATEWYGAGIPQNNVKQKKERTYESPFGHLTAGFKSGENTEPNRFG